jgi:hypothetical protein
MLILYTRIALEVGYTEGPRRPGRRGAKVDMLKGLVLNKDPGWKIDRNTATDITALGSGGAEVEYLIITSAALSSSFEPLRQWKSRKGLPAEIVTVEDIESGYPGSDLQEKVRNCIAAYCDSCGTDLVLLGGDTQIIPDRKAYVPLSDKPYLPCDLYYADLDGTWNEDGDLYWGEIPADNVDLYSDVYLGRAPVATPAEASAFVDKVLAYEGLFGVPQDYQLDMLFVGEVLWGDPSNPQDPDYTDAGVAKDLIDSLYVPSRFSIEKLYESQGTLDIGGVLAALSAGKNFINILCHGQYQAIAMAQDYLTYAHVANLENGPRYGLMYAVSCLSGGFDQNDCLGEAWVNNPSGGGFFIGNSRYGWNCPAFPGEGPSDLYDRSFFESVFLTGFTKLGKAHADAKHEFAGESRGDLYMRYLMYGLNLLGEPELSLWTELPQAVEVAYPACVELGNQVFEVEVSSGAGPVAGAMVCLLKEGEFYLAGDTGGDGSVSFPITASSEGIILVTVTKPNLLPHAGQAAVVSDGSPPQVPQGLTAHEQEGPSVCLEWEPVSTPDLCYYKIYRNTSPSPESLAWVPGDESAYYDAEVGLDTTYYYWVSGVDSAGNESDLSDPCSILVGDVTGLPGGDPAGTGDLRAEPNPFRGYIRLVCGDPDWPCPEIRIFDVRGRAVREVKPAAGGEGWIATWDGCDDSGHRLPAGIYLVAFSSDRAKLTRKVVFLR